MLVFPQTLNYRLIIGTLVIAIAVLGSYSISSYNSFKNQEEFLEQETKLVQNELNEMISLYDDVSVENETVKNELEEAKTDLPLISEYRNQISTLKKEKAVVSVEKQTLVKDNKILLAKVDSVTKQSENQRLRLETLTTIKETTIKDTKIVEPVNKVGVLKVDNIKLTALGTTSSLNVYETEKFSETVHIEVCATLSNNEFTSKGNKNIYVQILDKNDNVISERGLLKYKGKHLKYSGKTKIKNISESLTACLKISIRDKKKLEPGTYYVNVFQNGTLLGNSTIELN